MKWQFEITDCPKNPHYPITCYQVRDNGVKIGPSFIKLEDFLEAISTGPDDMLLDADALRMEETVVTPSLPFGTVRYSANADQTRERITMEIPKKQYDIRYGKDETMHFIGFPRMVVQYLVETYQDSRKVIETRLYAVLDDKQPITDDTPLFQFPYPNVGKENGIVCWGQNARFEIKELPELHKLFYSFISAPFNEDHGVRTTHGIPKFQGLLNQIEELAFDDEWLVPAGRKAFRDLFNI